VGWRLSGLRFGFPEASGPVFTGFDLAVKPGSFTVLIGPSGCGKSTLIGLLLGVVSPQSGSVEVLDGTSAAALSTLRPRLLRSVGYVGPESFLIEGTLRDNLLYGLGREPSSEEILLALRQAECDFVASLPLGLSHQLTEQGQGLSAGQKQRLSLARALLRRPTVLILDEATANLDSATEARLIETLGRFKGRMTIVAATHREALLTLADQVVRLG
jgi:ABC-type multidrug transport system fused ATPase/permease subunit